MNVVIIILLIYIIYEIKKNQGTKEEPECSFQDILPEFVGKTCEITLKEPLMMIDAVCSVKGTLADVDDEWVVMETWRKKKNTKIFRIKNISGINDLSDT